MKFKDKVIIVTGAASGIGMVLAERFLRQGAFVMMSDRVEPPAFLERLDTLDPKCKFATCDVTSEAQIQKLVADTQACFGPVDMFCSIAGLVTDEPDHAASGSDEDWQTSFEVHVMAQVYAARAVLPAMIERGEGHIVNMASAAGLLSQIGNAAYSATKHASVGFSESLAISHGDQGIKVSVICPQYVATSMTGYNGDEKPLSPGTITAEEAADTILEGIENGTFMISTHAELEQNFQNKASNYERWISGMKKLRRHILEKAGSTRLEYMHKLF